MGVGTLLGALIVLLDDDDLLPCLPARENDGDFSGLVYYEQSFSMVSSCNFVCLLTANHFLRLAATATSDFLTLCRWRLPKL